jgi:hypothetical protein
MTAKDAGRPLSAHLDQECLATKLHQALRQTLFSSGRRISPRCVNQVGQEMVVAFFKFLATEDEEAARACGRRLTAEGLGHCAILATTETLRRTCRESGNPVGVSPSVVGRYVNAPLEGYMAGREASLLQEQERTRRALQQAREQQDR